MKAAIYPGNGQPITIETLPDPQPGSDDVIIKVHRCGICGTDLSFTKGALFDFGTNSQFGHEYAGEVVSLGKNVSELRIGDKISLLPSAACGHCIGCAGGNNVLCTEPESLMHGFAELARVPVASAVKLPATLSMADGALIEPLAVGLYGLRHSSIKPGDNVLILGFMLFIGPADWARTASSPCRVPTGARRWCWKWARMPLSRLATMSWAK
jgi:threonine dehydrogenase-like Zn-dependent dehydrogenase